MHRINRICTPRRPKLGTQIAQMAVHRAVTYMDVHTGNRIDQCGARMDLIGARHQLDKQVHFPRRQGHDLSAHAGQVACGVDLKNTMAQGLILWRGATAPQNRLYTCHQFTG